MKFRYGNTQISTVFQVLLKYVEELQSDAILKLYVES
jgi:hypothetical protein